MANKIPLGGGGGVGGVLRDWVICIVCVRRAVSMPHSLLSLYQGQSEDTIRLIIKQGLIKLLLPPWLMTLQSLQPPGARNAHLLDVRSTADVKLALKLRRANAY